jgi:hypothetical protein
MINIIELMNILLLMYITRGNIMINVQLQPVFRAIATFESDVVTNTT